MRNAIQSEKVLYSDIVKKINDKVLDIESRQISISSGEQVKSAMTEYTQQKRHRKNVVLHGLPEPKGTWERKKRR